MWPAAILSLTHKQNAPRFSSFSVKRLEQQSPVEPLSTSSIDVLEIIWTKHQHKNDLTSVSILLDFLPITSLERCSDVIMVSSTMAGKHPIHIHAVRPLYRFAATGLGASMWFFVRIYFFPLASRNPLLIQRSWCTVRSKTVAWLPLSTKAGCVGDWILTP